MSATRSGRTGLQRSRSTRSCSARFQPRQGSCGPTATIRLRLRRSTRTASLRNHRRQQRGRVTHGRHRRRPILRREQRRRHFDADDFQSTRDRDRRYSIWRFLRRERRPGTWHLGNDAPGLWRNWLCVSAAADAARNICNSPDLSAETETPQGAGRPAFGVSGSRAEQSLTGARGLCTWTR